MKKGYRAHMDANQGVPADHPANSMRKTVSPSQHKAFVSKATKSSLGAVMQPSPASAGKKLGAKKAIRG